MATNQPQNNPPNTLPDQSWWVAEFPDGASIVHKRLLWRMFIPLFGLNIKDIDELIQRGVFVAQTREGYSGYTSESVAVYFYDVFRAIIREVIAEENPWTTTNTRRSVRDSLRLQKPPTS